MSIDSLPVLQIAMTHRGFRDEPFYALALHELKRNHIKRCRMLTDNPTSDLSFVAQLIAESYLDPYTIGGGKILLYNAPLPFRAGPRFKGAQEILEIDDTIVTLGAFEETNEINRNQLLYLSCSLQRLFDAHNARHASQRAQKVRGVLALQTESPEGAFLYH